ncbi:hypothetical protein N4T20_14650 [Flavobacterium sp. TR2]|uniref:hypothetical protein n=1 Tax=Flavobacterium sp. TR2 TaxID=2977321 RepID=UPI0021B12DA7|nr:hypothetical protein [Flavobacterium sp. TR2]UWY26961.1 hypothetical protein N4T20_14650 [Flavobacterium sp. TR2]
MKTIILKKSLIIIITIILLFVGYKQYEVETYINKQKETYGILKDKKRIHYMPFAVHFLSGEINNTRNYRAEAKAFFMAYDIVNVKSAYTDKDFDSYMVYCYFSKEEIDRYYNQRKKKDSPKKRLRSSM